ncbi:hypothetical protein PT2222_140150 [Paraburkholderia tropica]
MVIEWECLIALLVKLNVLIVKINRKQKFSLNGVNVYYWTMSWGMLFLVRKKVYMLKMIGLTSNAQTVKQNLCQMWF